MPLAEAWHEAGRGPSKETTITDVIDCAESLVGHGYTRPGWLAGKGESAGGITAGVSRRTRSRRGTAAHDR